MSLVVHQMTRSRDAWMLARAQARAGNLTEALSLLTEVNRAEPDNVQAWSLACSLAARLRNWSLMMQTAGAWVRSSPESAQAWQSLSHACFEQKLFADAIAAFDKVLALEPENFRHRVSAARIATAAENFDLARQHLEQAELMSPDSCDVYLASCRLNYLTGELEQAEADCRRALAISPNLAPAYITLGQLCQGKLSDSEVDAIQRLLGVPQLNLEYKSSLYFTLGEALDRKGDSGAAFSAWQEANRVNLHISRQEGIRYKRAQQEEETRMIKELFSDLKSNLPVMNASRQRKIKPVFVLGMPRSGTTIIESVLASHSAVEGGGELPMLPLIHDEVIALARRIGVGEAREAMVCKLGHWRERYLAALPELGNNTTWVVDKQPLNFRSIGLIKTLFPESPIILTERNALDVGLSIYRHDFTKNWPCAHRLEDIGHYMGCYKQLINHWRENCEAPFHIIKHDDFVTKPDKRIRDLLAFAGLSEEPACFQPHQTKRSVSTFSAVQVRQPISSAFTGQAQRYMPYLEPLIAALKESGIDMA